MNPAFHAKGVALIVVALFADAGTSNFEEKRLFRVAQPSSQAEVIFYSSGIATAYGLLVMLPTGELGPAMAHSLANRSVVPLLSAAAVCGYCSVTFILLLIKHHGATNTEIVKSCRKARAPCVGWRRCRTRVAALGCGPSAPRLPRSELREASRSRGGGSAPLAAQVLSILLSFLLYPKPMNAKYVGGLVRPAGARGARGEGGRSGLQG